MKKPAIPILIFTIVSNVIAIYAIISSGVGVFILFWWKSSLKYTLGIAMIAFLWYLMWIKRISNKKEFVELSELDYNESLNLNADKDLMPTMCPKCENDCYYFSNEPNESHILICWNCQHTFSFAWCEKCGMGGDFITDIPRNPSSWECPKCHSTYSTSSNIFVNPTKTMSDRTLPINVNLSRLVRQMKFEKEQAIISIWFLSSSLISFTLVSPIVNSVNKAFTITEPTSPLVSGLVFIIVFISTWYGLVFYPLALMKKFERSKNESP